MMFLHKIMDIFINDKNKDKIIEIFKTFNDLNRMNLKKLYNMTLNQLVFEQKRRIETFDRIFNSLFVLLIIYLNKILQWLYQI